MDITPKMIRDFRRIKLEKGLAPRTINKHISAIRSALSYAVRAEIIPDNKLLGPHRLLLREEQKPVKILMVEEVTKLLNAATDLRHRTAISLAYYHGLRRREICNLQWQDIKFEEKRLDVVSRRNARTKTRVSRSIYLRQETADLLMELAKNKVNEFVFSEPIMFYWTFDKWFKKLVSSVGLSSFSLHDLRKTCNTLMKNAGISPEAAMQILGHTTFKVNQRHYTGVLTAQQERAINSLPSVG